MVSVSLIVLGVVLLVGSYTLYQYLLGNSASLVQNTYLKTQAAPIPMTNYAASTSARSSYGFWIFVNKLESTTDTKLFWIADPSSTSSLLEVSITNNAELGVKVADKLYSVTENFPLQKWERIDLSFDNKVMDVYLDGKLLRSVQMPTNFTTLTTSQIYFGQIDAYVSGFGRKPTPANPADVYSGYMSGNKPFSYSWMPQYGMSVELTKDSVAQKKLTLF